MSCCRWLRSCHVNHDCACAGVSCCLWLAVLAADPAAWWCCLLREPSRLPLGRCSNDITPVAGLHVGPTCASHLRPVICTTPMAQLASMPARAPPPAAAAAAARGLAVAADKLVEVTLPSAAERALPAASCASFLSCMLLQVLRQRHVSVAGPQPAHVQDHGALALNVCPPAFEVPVGQQQLRGGQAVGWAVLLPAAGSADGLHCGGPVALCLHPQLAPHAGGILVEDVA